MVCVKKAKLKKKSQKPFDSVISKTSERTSVCAGARHVLFKSRVKDIHVFLRKADRGQIAQTFEFNFKRALVDPSF